MATSRPFRKRRSGVNSINNLLTTFFVNDKEPFHKSFLYEIHTKFLLFAKQKLQKLAGNFALFAIQFLPKFDEIDASVKDIKLLNHCSGQIS